MKMSKINNLVKSAVVTATANKKRKIISASSVVVLAIIAITISRMSGSHNGMAFKMPPAAVTTTKVVAEFAPQNLQVVGTVKANNKLTISPEIGGHIAKVYFSSGQEVKAGQPLVQLDDEIYRSQLAAAQADLAVSKAHYERILHIFKKGLSSQEEMDTASNEYHDKQALVNQQQTRLDKMCLRAQFAGRMTAATIGAGAFVNVGQDIATLVDDQDLRVDFDVPEKYYGEIALNSKVNVISRDHPNMHTAGTVSYVAPLIDETTRTFEVTAKFTKGTTDFAPGLFVNVIAHYGNKDKRLLIPEESIVPTLTGATVYKIKNNKAISTPVTIGAHWNSKVVVLKGLQAGDEVVTTGQEKLKNGAKVRRVKA